MRFLKRLAYPALGLMLAFGISTTVDTPSASAQCRYYYGTTSPNCYDEELDTEPCIYYYGTTNGCGSRWNRNVDDSLPAYTPPATATYGYPYGPGNYGSDSSTYGQSSTSTSGTPPYGPSGPMYGTPPSGYYGAPGYYYGGPQPPSYGGPSYYGR